MYESVIQFLLLFFSETTKVHEQIWKTEEKVRWKEEAPNPRITKSCWYQSRGKENGALIFRAAYMKWPFAQNFNGNAAESSQEETLCVIVFSFL